MPYITQGHRAELDNSIDDLVNSIDLKLKDGQLNYIITKLVDSLYYTNYKDLNAAIGVLECAKQELYRRVVAPYEDIKIKENGDAYSIDR